jgi:hypothetical protein
MLHEARHHCINTLPESVKSTAASILRTALVSQNNRKELDQIIEFMMNGDSIDPSILLNNIKITDARRNQRLDEHHPELAQAIGYD